MTLAIPQAGAVRQHDAVLDEIVAQIVRDLPALLSIDAAGDVLGKSGRTIRSYIARGLIRAIRPCGGTRLIPRSEIARVLREGAADG
jgi:excisionase family DNA binding protein